MQERGLHRLPSVAVQTRFPFGVLEASLGATCDEEVLVLPRLGHIRREALLGQSRYETLWLRTLAQKDAEGEFRSLREYQYGDNPRHIHWPTTARLRKLYVREFDRREMQGVLILLDAHAPAETPAESEARQERFEKAVSFVATLASVLNAQGIDYGFASYCPDLTRIPYDCGVGHFYSVLRALALAQMTPARTLGDLVATLGADLSGSGVCVASPGPMSGRSWGDMLSTRVSRPLLVDVGSAEFYDAFSI
jgi:uncharacterized protein (DUF58 family)